MARTKGREEVEKKTPKKTAKKTPGKKPTQIGGKKKTRKASKTGKSAIKEIKKYQKSTELLLRKLPFQRLVRELMQEIKTDVRFTAESLVALQEATESHLVNLFENANLAAIHSDRVTVSPKDIKLARKMCMGQACSFEKSHDPFFDTFFKE